MEQHVGNLQNPSLSSDHSVCLLTLSTQNRIQLTCLILLTVSDCKSNTQNEESTDMQKSSEESHAEEFKKDIIPMIIANKCEARLEKQWEHLEEEGEVDYLWMLYAAMSSQILSEECPTMLSSRTSFSLPECPSYPHFTTLNPNQPSN